ncbi:hypothetical protein HBI88_150370 [Parastagonospora nodorum]|nr:hypothetical protein HBI94_153010 [Parastagonospora nodorum]KAH5841744.1 hypothetical protein HBI93_011840 [Parastagonospora nodorum]KAH5919764.1 hypothetical protein HBI88_150370 [Parastagonospora nodorum]
MTDSPRARTLINPSAVLYEQSAAQPSLPAKVGNIDLDFVPSVAFIPDVHIADSLRARTLINLSAVLYEQAAARTSLPAEVSNIDLDFVPSVAFIPDVHIADSLRARTLINLSAVLYKQAAARTSLSAKVGNISSTSPRARTLINLSAVLYEQADARSGLSAEVSIIDLNFVPGVAFDAMGNVELTGDLLGNADRVNNNNNNVAPTLQFSPTALLNPRSLASKRPASSGSDLDCRRTDPTIATSLAKRIKTDEDRKKSTHRQGFNGSSSLKLQKISSRIKVSFRQAGNNRNNLNIIVTDSTGREFGRVDMKSLTRLSYDIGKFHKGKNIQLLRPVFKLQRYDYYNLQDSNSLTRIQAIDPSFQTDQFTYVDEIQANVANVFDTVISKSDKVPTRELSSHIKTELLRDNGCKFYRLVIIGEDTHCKQTIKKAYIMSLERASLILFIT